MGVLPAPASAEFVLSGRTVPVGTWRNAGPVHLAPAVAKDPHQRARWETRQQARKSYALSTCASAQRRADEHRRIVVPVQDLIQDYTEMSPRTIGTTCAEMSSRTCWWLSCKTCALSCNTFVLTCTVLQCKLVPQACPIGQWAPMDAVSKAECRCYKGHGGKG